MIFKLLNGVICVATHNMTRPKISAKVDVFKDILNFAVKLGNNSLMRKKMNNLLKNKLKIFNYKKTLEKIIQICDTLFFL